MDHLNAPNTLCSKCAMLVRPIELLELSLELLKKSELSELSEFIRSWIILKDRYPRSQKCRQFQ